MTIMILLWRFRDHNDFALEIIFTKMVLHVQGSSWRHFVLALVARTARTFLLVTTGRARTSSIVH